MDGVAEFRAGAAIGGRAMDASRSFLEHAMSFPENINVEATLTFTSGAGGAGDPAGGGGGGRGGGRAGMRGPSGTVLVHHSIMKLPEKPMMERNFDERVGFDTEGVTDFGTDEQRSVRDRIIRRFRLEKKDPNAPLSDPVKPIVFYIDPATPAKWVPFRQTRRRVVAAGVRSRRLQERDPREGRADQRPRVERGRRAVFDHSLGAGRDRIAGAHR